MDSSVREDAIDLKIKLLREKNQQIERRHKLIEEDKKYAHKEGRAVDHQPTASSHAHFQKDRNQYGHRAHMDAPVDEWQEGPDVQHRRHSERERHPQDRRPQQHGPRAPTDVDRRPQQHGPRAPTDVDRRPQQHGPRAPTDVDRRPQRHGPRDPTDVDRRSNKNRNKRSDWNDGEPPAVSDRRVNEREQQRRSNIDKMEAQMSGKVQVGDEDFQEPRGFLHDPSREGEGEFTRRPPPRSVQYNHRQDRPRYNRNYNGPRSKMEMSVEMTGRQRRDYEQWKVQQDEADKARMTRAQSDGHWRREWDTEKSDRNEKHEGRGDNRRGYEDSHRNDRYQRGGGRNDREWDRNDRPRKKTNEEDALWGEEEQWPSLDNTENNQTSHQHGNQPRKQRVQRKERTSKSREDKSDDSSEKQEEGRSANGNNRNTERERSQTKDFPKSPDYRNNPFTQQPRGRGGKGRGRGRGRGRSHDNRRPGGSGNSEAPSTSRNQPNLTVDVNAKQPPPVSEAEKHENAESEASSAKSLNRTSSLTSPLNAPENFMQVTDWAKEVELNSPSYDMTSEEVQKDLNSSVEMSAPESSKPNESVKAKNSDPLPQVEETTEENDEIEHSGSVETAEHKAPATESVDARALAQQEDLVNQSTSEEDEKVEQMGAADPSVNAEASTLEYNTDKLAHQEEPVKQPESDDVQPVDAQTRSEEVVVSAETSDDSEKKSGDSSLSPPAEIVKSQEPKSNPESAAEDQASAAASVDTDTLKLQQEPVSQLKPDDVTLDDAQAQNGEVTVSGEAPDQPKSDPESAAEDQASAAASVDTDTLKLQQEPVSQLKPDDVTLDDAQAQNGEVTVSGEAPDQPKSDPESAAEDQASAAASVDTDTLKLQEEPVSQLKPDDVTLDDAQAQNGEVTVSGEAPDQPKSDPESAAEDQASAAASVDTDTLKLQEEPVSQLKPDDVTLDDAQAQNGEVTVSGEAPDLKESSPAETAEDGELKVDEAAEKSDDDDFESVGSEGGETFADATSGEAVKVESEVCPATEAKSDECSATNATKDAECAANQQDVDDGERDQNTTETELKDTSGDDQSGAVCGDASEKGVDDEDVQHQLVPEVSTEQAASDACDVTQTEDIPAENSSPNNPEIKQMQEEGDATEAETNNKDDDDNVRVHSFDCGTISPAPPKHLLANISVERICSAVTDRGIIAPHRIPEEHGS